MTTTDPKEFKRWMGCLPPANQDRLVLIPLVRGGKEPDVKFGESWNDPKYHLSPQDALDRLGAGKNVGAVGTKDTIAILDIERQNVQKAQAHIPQNIVDTLIGKTRNGGLHLYYLNGGVPNRDLTEDGKKLIEIRADNKYVVAPGSFVPPDEEGGGGLYHVVNERPPLPLVPSDLPWLVETAEVQPQPTEPIDFGGEYMSLPCIRVLFEVPLSHGRKVHAAKLLAIAWVKDKGTPDGFASAAKALAAFQDHPDFRMDWRQVNAWAMSVHRNKREWNCGEAITLFRENGIFPPCSGCPMKEVA